MNTNFIVDKNGTGKTRKLLEFAKEKNAEVICQNPTAMKHKAEAYGIIGLTFISYDEAIRHDYSSLMDSFVVDEVSNFLSYFLDHNCIGFTQTQD